MAPSASPSSLDVRAEIRAEMARRGWSVRQLAGETGIKYVTLSRRMAGDDNLTVPELARICSAFGIAVSTLIARSEDAA